MADRHERQQRLVVWRDTRWMGIERVTVDLHDGKIVSASSSLAGAIEVGAMLLGHSSIDTTMIYVRPGFQDLADAVEMI